MNRIGHRLAVLERRQRAQRQQQAAWEHWHDTPPDPEHERWLARYHAALDRAYTARGYPGDAWLTAPEAVKRAVHEDVISSGIFPGASGKLPGPPRPRVGD